VGSRIAIWEFLTVGGGCGRCVGFAAAGLGRFVADPDDVGIGFVIPGIKDAAEFIVALDEGVRFINEKRRLFVGNDAEEGRRADVRRQDWMVDELA